MKSGASMKYLIALAAFACAPMVAADELPNIGETFDQLSIEALLNQIELDMVNWRP
jgi:hypothetical protein